MGAGRQTRTILRTVRAADDIAGNQMTRASPDCSLSDEIVVLTIRQPWAWAILHAGKAIENRSKRTHYRGPLWIHAASQMDTAALAALRRVFDVPELPTGALVGVVSVVGCTAVCDSPWFVGPYGWELASQRALPEPIPMAGQLSTFRRRLAVRIQLTAKPTMAMIPPYGKAQIRQAVSDWYAGRIVAR
jgi:hypothetical protein